MCLSNNNHVKPQSTPELDSIIKHNPFSSMIYQLKQIPLHRKKRIILISEARSGSSFLGDLLQQAWPSYYSYEPLIIMRQKHPRNDVTKVSQAAQLISQLFRCNFTNLDHGSLLTPSYYKMNYLNWNLLMSKMIDELKS
jgi:hypothetical protein